MNKPRLFSFLPFLSCLFFPPKCCSCGDFLQRDILDTEPRALCETCRAKWEYAGLTVCPNCGEELFRCDCMPRILKNAGAAAALKLVSYEKERDSVSRRCVLTLKRKNNKRAADFFGGELARAVVRYLEASGTDAKSVYVTFVPRGKKNALAQGFDQSEKLAEALAQRLGAPHGRLLGRRRYTDREQKRLGKAARFANASGAFCLADADFEALDRSARCLMLVDDVMTTGASLAACTRLLRESFHGRIVSVTLARTAEAGR